MWPFDLFFRNTQPRRSSKEIYEEFIETKVRATKWDADKAYSRYRLANHNANMSETARRAIIIDIMRYEAALAIIDPLTELLGDAFISECDRRGKELLASDINCDSRYVSPRMVSPERLALDRERAEDRIKRNVHTVLWQLIGEPLLDGTPGLKKLRHMVNDDGDPEALVSFLQPSLV